jgi:hypothetical protein
LIPLSNNIGWKSLKAPLPEMGNSSKGLWSIVAEWLGCRTLNQRVVGSNPGEGTA